MKYLKAVFQPMLSSCPGEEGGILAAKAKHQVIMTPGSHCYFDHYQSTYAKEPLAIGSYLPLERVYSYNPIPPVLTKQQSSYIKELKAMFGLNTCLMKIKYFIWHTQEHLHWLK